MSEAHIRVSFGFVGDLVVLVLLAATYFDIYIILMHPTERKLVPYCLPPMPKLTVHKVGGEVKMHKKVSRQSVVERLKL